MPEQTPRPVPISERMPDRSDCDARGHCWWFLQSDQCSYPTWAFGPYRIGKGLWRQTHWLPADALPVPHTITT